MAESQFTYEFYRDSNKKIPCYIFFPETDTEEKFYPDFIAAMNEVFSDDEIYNSETEYFVIAAFKPIGITITEENKDEFIKWIVEDCDEMNEWFFHMNCEWDFQNHKPIKYNKQ